MTAEVNGLQAIPLRLLWFFPEAPVLSVAAKTVNYYIEIQQYYWFHFNSECLSPWAKFEWLDSSFHQKKTTERRVLDWYQGDAFKMGSYTIVHKIGTFYSAKSEFCCNFNKNRLRKSIKHLNDKYDLTILNAHEISAFKVLSSITICSTVVFLHHRMFLFLWSTAPVGLKVRICFSLTFCLCFLPRAWPLILSNPYWKN